MCKLIRGMVGGGGGSTPINSTGQADLTVEMLHGAFSTRGKY